MGLSKVKFFRKISRVFVDRSAILKSKSTGKQGGTLGHKSIIFIHFDANHSNQEMKVQFQKSHYIGAKIHKETFLFGFVPGEALFCL